MGSRRLLAVALVLAGLLVWQLLARRGGPAAERAGPARGATAAEEKSPEPPDAPKPAEGSSVESAKPSEAPAKEQGIRVRVLAEGKLLADAYVYAMAADDELHLLAKEEAGTYFAGATGDLTVGAAHARFGPARREIRAPEGAITDVSLELPAGETLDVLVISDRGGAPVAGASVFVLRAGGPALDGGNTGLEDAVFDNKQDPEQFDFSILGTLDMADFMQLGGSPAVAIPELTTDALGRARVAGLPPGTVDIVVSHPDFVATRLRRQPVGKEAVARLSGGGSLTVLPPFVDGRAAEGYLCGAVRPGLMLSMPVGSARVDAEGKAFFPHLPPGPLRILVAKARHPFSLMALAMGGSAAETVEIDEDLAAEEGKVPAEGEAAPEPRKKQEAITKLAEGNVTIIAGEHKTLDLRETKGARIEGLFVMGEEESEGAFVLLLSGEEFKQQVGMQQTDDLGKFAFEGIGPGKYRVTAAGSAGRIARAECEVKEGDSVVTVRLETPVGSIVGRILGADGKPAKDGRVLAAPREGGKGQARSLPELMEQLAGFGEADEDGRFRLIGLVPGEYRVLGALGPRLDVADVMLRAGEEAQVEFRLDDARLRRLLVRLEGADGKAVEGSVSLLGPDGGNAETLALMDEDVEITAVPKGSATHEFFLASGRYRLVATAPGLASALGEPVEIAGDRDVTLTLGPGVRVELVLEGREGPLANRDVDIRNEHGIGLGGHSPFELMLGGQGLRTDGGGVLALDAVPPGRYTLLVDGKEKGRVEVAGAPVTKRIRVE